MIEEEKTPVQKKPLLRKIRRALLGILLLAVLLFLTLLTLLFVYQDEVKAAVIAEINRHLKVEVNVAPANIDLTIIKTFPDCSMQFKDILIFEALPQKQRDTLIFASRLNLHFNIKDLWNKKYAIQKIIIKDAILKPKILKDGKNNFTIWEGQSTEKTNDSKVNFDIQLLKLEHCRIDFENKQSFFDCQFLVQDLVFKGHFGDSKYDLASEGKLFVNKISYKKESFIKEKDINFIVSIDVLNDRYNFKKAYIHLNQLQFDLNGGFSFKDSLSHLKIDYRAPNIDIASLLSLLPEKYRDKINDYKSSGNFYSEGKLNYESNKDFMFESDFGIKNAVITYIPKSTSIKQVGIEGHLKLDAFSSLLEIKNIHVAMNDDELNGSGFIKNFSDPYIQYKGAATVNLANLQAFWPIDTITKLQGELKINADLEGALKDFKDQTFSQKVKLDIAASVNNVEAQFKNDEQLYAIESGSLEAFQREIELKNLKLKRGSSDVVLSGQLKGIYNYLSEPNASLTVSGDLFSSNLKLEDFMLKNKASGGESDLIPANVNFKLNAEIQKFTFSKFLATDIVGEVEVKNKKAIVSNMTLKTMDGNATIDLFADNTDRKLNIVLQSKIAHLNIQELFSEFNNFGQTTLVDKNIKGFISADIDFSGNWNNHLDVDLSSIRANCDIDIEGGELIDFKPLVSLSKYIDLRDLQRIKFSSLRSEIVIKDKTINFPKTLIENSALNLTFSGTHSFENAIDYHIRLAISEFLAKKIKSNDEFGPVEEDKEKRRTAFILMTGTLDNPIVKFDRKGQKAKIKEDIKQESQNIKNILKEELGLFKKENSAPKENKSEQKFELEKPNNNNPKKTLEIKKKPEEEDF